MSKIVYRPRTTKKRASSKEDFELCYLRHKYLRKTLYNPTNKDMDAYEAIVNNICRHTFFTYKYLLHAVGFDLEDVENIGRVHLTSFLGLFSLESNSGKYAEFVGIYEKNFSVTPQVTDLLDKNRANFTLFLKQRMEELVRICRQKVRNVKGVPMEAGLFFVGPRMPPRDLSSLMEDPGRYGFKKIENAAYRTARKRAGKTDKEIFKYGRKWYVAFPVRHRVLGLVDFSGSGMDPYDNIHNMTPEQILFHKEEEESWEKKKEDFRKKSKNDRIKMISQFIRKNSNNPKFEEEVEIAEKYLKRLGAELE